MHSGVSWPSVLVVLGVLGVVVVAAADTFRPGQGERHAAAAEPALGGALAERLRRAALSGALHYTDPACVRRSLSLPQLESSPAQRVACENELRPRRPAPAAGPAFPDGRPRSGCRRAIIDLVAQRRVLRRLPGCARAALPDGSLVMVEGETVVARTARCGAEVADCTRVLLAGKEVRRAALRHPSLPRGGRGTGVTVLDVGWVGEDRYAALLAAWAGGRLARLGPQLLLAFFDRGRVGATAPLFAGGDGVAVSPRGSFVAAAGEPLALFRADGTPVPLERPFADGHAIAWSPDERWTAVATRSSVLLVRTDELLAHTRTGLAPSLLRVPVAVRDLSWSTERR